MSAKIFISYSRKDQRAAFSLRDMLRAEGWTVWIDQEAIEAATQWSAEIVENIKSCDVFIILLSHTSASSHNVTKELSLASENLKTVLPIELEQVQLPSSLEYALAGIQKVQYKDTEAILRGLRRYTAEAGSIGINKVIEKNFFARYRIALALGIVAIACAVFYLKPTATSEVKNSGKVMIAVIPFGVLNSDHDSTATLDVFTDGIMTQISSKDGLQAVTRKKAGEFINSDLRPIAIAKKLDARFIIDGTVRKSQDRLTVSARLYDVTAGVDIWSKEYSGSMMQLLQIKDTLGIEIIQCVNRTLYDERFLLEAEQQVHDHPNDKKALRTLALKYQFSNKPKSIELMEKVNAIDSVDPYSYTYLAQSYLGVNLLEKSRAIALKGMPVFEKAIKLNPLNVFQKMNYAGLIIYSGYPDRAVNYLLDILKDINRSKMTRAEISECFYSIACILSQENKFDSSLDNLDSCMKYSPFPDRITFSESDPDLDNVRNLPRFRKIMYGK